jgi:hypothetical protein
MGLSFSTIRDTVYSVGGIIKPGSETEETLFSDTTAAPETGEISGPLTFIPIMPPQFGLNLASFGAKTTRTFLIGEIGGDGRLLPLHYANIAAVILHREAGNLRQALPPLLEDHLLIPFAHLPDPKTLPKLQEYGLPFLDTESPSDSFVEMRRAALAASNRAANEMLSRAIAAWREDYGGEGQILAIAGNLSDIPKDRRSSDVVSVTDASSVLATYSEGFVGNLPVGEMTHPFSLDDGRLYFYLRLRDNTLKDPGYGLVRVEFMSGDGIRNIDYAKALAFYILSERIPINPALMGANQIYPLSACLDYMLDFTVEQRTVDSYFGRRD